MPRPTSRRSRRFAIALLAFAGALLLAATASAATETFHRLEVVATANYTLTEGCADGSTAETLVTVIGGHEAESVNGESTLDSDFVTVLLRGFDCEGNLLNDRGSGEARFAWTPNLRVAGVLGRITTRDGRRTSVAMGWLGTGRLEVTRNVTEFPGFRGVFVGKRRDAIATGTVFLDGERLVAGSTDNAEIESLEDTNTTTS